MSLVVILKNFQGLKCKGEKVARIEFRGNVKVHVYYFVDMGGRRVIFHERMRALGAYNFFGFDIRFAAPSLPQSEQINEQTNRINRTRDRERI